jgi:hypothetical protein
MVSFKGRAALSAGLLLALAGLNPVLAEVPGVLDRVPANAAMIVTVRDMEQFRSRAEDMATTLKAPIDSEDEHNPLAVTKKLLAADGLDKHGSFAITFMPGADGKVDFDMEGGPVVMIVPVTNYATFAKGLGALETKGVVAVKFNDKDGFAKDLGGGFAAVSEHKEMVEAFDGKAGNLAKHKTNMGKAGTQIADKSDLMLVVSVAGLKPQLEQGVAGMKEQMKMAGAMAAQGGEEAKVMMDFMSNAADSFVRDGQVGIVGLGLGDSGVSLDFGAQYKEGTATAKVLSSTGNATKILARLPNQPFLFAFAMDLSGPGIKQIIKDASAASAAAAKGADKADPMGGLNSWDALGKSIDKVDGTASVMGANQAGLMGIFANTASFVATSDPAGYIAAARDTLKAMSGKEVNGMKFDVKYEPAAVEVSDVKADTWSMKFNADPNDPAAGQMNMIMPILFGQDGLGGMTAAVEGGVISTLSKNTPLFTKSIEAAKTGKGLAEDEQIKEVQKHLPENRTFEMYLGTKSILDTINSLMGMFGGGVDMKVPDKVSPIGLAASADGGGLDFRLFVPNDVIKTGAAIAAESMKGDGPDDAAPAPAGDKPKSPRF